MEGTRANHRVRLAVACGLVAPVLTACSSHSSSDQQPPATAASSSVVPAPSDDASVTDTPTASDPTDGRDLDVDELVVPPAAPALPAAWQERFVIGCGPGKTLLGTSPGGDSGSLEIGPEYGAPAPDGSWWFLDAAKARIAHYDSSGRFLGQVKVTKELLIG